MILYWFDEVVKVTRCMIIVYWKDPPPPSYSYPPEMVNNYCTLSYVVIFCKTIFFCAKLVEDDKKIQMPDALVCYNKWVPMSV